MRQGGREGGLGRRAGGEAPQRSEGDLMGAVVVFCEVGRKGPAVGVAAGAGRGRRAGQGGGGAVVAVVIGSGVARGGGGRAATPRACWLTTTRSWQAPLAETWAPQLADAVKRVGAGALLGTADVDRQGHPAARGGAARRRHGLRHHRGVGARTGSAARLRGQRPRRGRGRRHRSSWPAFGRPRSPPRRPAAAPGAVETVAVGAVDALGAELVGAARDARARGPSWPRRRWWCRAAAA